ncbi:MAG: TlpA disulfide reductase family protein [Prevotella sp.]|nr:TlpA disulfide reductase family protein [Prevotella sp.]
MKSLLLGIFMGSLMVACTNTDVKCMTGEDDSIIHTGDSLPAFSVTSSDGAIYSDQSLKDKVAVIVFFNTNCPDCRQELPVINDVYGIYRNNQQVNFIAISRAQNTEDVAAYWMKQNFQIPYSAQSDQTVYHLFAIQDIPRIYITDRTGRVRFVSSDTDMPDAATLIGAIKQYLPSL